MSLAGIGSLNDSSPWPGDGIAAVGWDPWDSWKRDLRLRGSSNYTSVALSYSV